MPGSASDVILKAVVLFLVFMGVLAMFGKLTLPKPREMGRQMKARVQSATKCPSCGRYNIGKGPCPCRTKKQSQK